MTTCDCPEFLRRAERRLGEEADRVHAYLDSSTEAKVTRVVESTLIGQQVRRASCSHSEQNLASMRCCCLGGLPQLACAEFMEGSL